MSEKIEAVAWRCFHCDETFTDTESAALHFGTHERHSPACTIDVAEYRRMEAMGERYAEEDAEVHRSMYRMQNEHSVELRRAEEAGYARGLNDSAIDTLRAEVEALLVDAERYRWLQKATPYRFKKIQDACISDAVDVLYFHKDRFDAAVDAARQEEA